ncbi:MAG: response regulator [Gammaproteobacteria bacterium]|nr:response regulator [Gammaproteobacteria bacterium]
MSDDLKQQLALANARAERLKKARHEAEKLLEEKSRELFAANQQLEEIQQNLQQDIQQATYELEVTNARLQSALDGKSAFLGQMSHEVRTPLNAIIGLSEILLGTRLDEAQHDYMSTINNGAKSMIVLIDDLLDITKIEAGRVDICPEPVDVHDLLRNINGMFELSAKQKDLQLDLQIDNTVPGTISIDVGRYTQIINNLISNAIKNTPQGRVFVQVGFRASADDDGGVLITKVVDTGIGIEATQLERIFGAYEQIGRPGQGAGLGLSICRQLCELMNGEISCESIPGRGSIFSVKLPVRTSTSRDLQASTEATASLPSLPPLRILVAEDNPTNQKVLTAQLAQLGQTPDMVENGAEAMEKIAQSEYDVVILDIQMPVMTGEETLQAIRDSAPSISTHYCIALTASTYQNQEARLLRLGFDAFLSKPLDLQVLAEALMNVPESLSMSLAEESSFIDWDNVVETLEEGAFDFTYLKTQFGEAHRAIFAEIAPSFLQHSYRELEQLIAHAQASEIEKISARSHSIKGAASSLGLNDLANILLRIENKPAAEDVVAKVTEVKIYMDQLKPIMERELAQCVSEG